MAEVWQIKTSDGEVYTFNTLGNPGDMSYDSMYHVLKGASGHHGVPIKYTSDVVPKIAGEEIREEIIEVRTIYMPIRVQGITPADMHRNLARLRRSLMLRREVQLWITNQEGETRVLYCRYTDGFDKVTDDDKQSPVFRLVPMHLTAYDDPYFYDIPGNEVTHSTSYEAPTVPFFDDDPWFSSPWRLGRMTVGETFMVFNNGDDNAYPVWTITGPGRAPILDNLTTGDSFGIEYVLAIGETVTIDMRDRKHTVISQVTTVSGTTRTNLRKYMIPGKRTMWPIVPGPNELKIELSGEAGDSSNVFMSFLPCYEGI